MAKVIGPLHSTQARGRVGGVVYNVWRGLNTVKAKVSPAQPRTARQLLIRSYLTTCSRAWAALTSAQRIAWNAYAADHPETDWTGTPKRITGEDWYCRCNVRLLDMGQAVITNPPAVAAPGAVESLVLTPGAGQISCAHAATAGTNLTIDYWIQQTMSAGVLPKINRAAHHTYGPGETTPNVITGLAAGLATVWARVIDENTGLASTWVMAQATVT